jgi:hypothetical protein
VLDVGQQQLLVLLLVRDAELDQRRCAGSAAAAASLVDVRAPGRDLGERRPRQHAAMWPGDALALAS